MLSPVKIWRNQKKIANLIGKRGEIISWTVIRVPPGNFSSFAPYPVVLLEIDKSKYFTCQLVDWENKHLVFGQKVELVLRKITEPSGDGVIPYGIKAKPI